MKAISLWQPWASLWACQEKQYETRSWKTSYRGPIAIHAAMKDPKAIFESLPVNVQFKMSPILLEHYLLWENVPRGAIIATAELVNCWYIVYHPGTNIDVAKHIPVGAESLTTDKHAPDFADYFVPTEKEMLFGDWAPGRYAWEIRNVHLLPEPIPCRGKQGLWNWEQAEAVK